MSCDLHCLIKIRMSILLIDMDVPVNSCHWSCMLSKLYCWLLLLPVHARRYSFPFPSLEDDWVSYILCRISNTSVFWDYMCQTRILRSDSEGSDIYLQDRPLSFGSSHPLSVVYLSIIWLPHFLNSMETWRPDSEVTFQAGYVGKSALPPSDASSLIERALNGGVSQDAASFSKKYTSWGPLWIYSLGLSISLIPIHCLNKKWRFH